VADEININRAFIESIGKFALHSIIIYSQYMMNKKQIILIVIALLIASGGIFAVLLYKNQTYYQEEPYMPPVPPDKIAISPSAQWTTYHNSTYHYRIDYPSHFESTSPFLNPDNIGFSEKDNPAQISVHIEQTSFHTPEEWLKAMDEKNRQYDQYREEKDKKKPPSIIERDIIMSGIYRGIIVRYPQSGEDALKSALFIKDSFLFSISVRNLDIDHERVWKSFQFE